MKDQGGVDHKSTEEFAWSVYSATKESIRFADTKASILLVVTGILFASISTDLLPLARGEPFPPGLAGVTLALFLVAFIGQVVVTLVQVGARRGPEQSANLVYFRAIASRKPLGSYRKALAESDAEGRLDDICSQIQIISRIAHQKFVLVNVSIACLLAQVLLVAVRVLLRWIG